MPSLKNICMLIGNKAVPLGDNALDELPKLSGVELDLNLFQSIEGKFRKYLKEEKLLNRDTYRIIMFDVDMIAYQEIQKGLRDEPEKDIVLGKNKYNQTVCGRCLSYEAKPIKNGRRIFLLVQLKMKNIGEKIDENSKFEIQDEEQSN